MSNFRGSSRIQSRPVEGPFGVIDLILPQQDPRDRLLRLCFLFFTPFSIGVLIGLVATNKMVVAVAGIGLGALMSVSAVFFRPDTLAPPLRQQLRTAQLVYGLFVLSCTGLSAIGAVAPDLIFRIWRNESIREDLIVQVIASILVTVVSHVAIHSTSKLVARVAVASTKTDAFPKKENELRELIREVIVNEVKPVEDTVDSKEHSAIPQKLPETQQSEGRMLTLTSNELEKVLRKIIREELKAAGVLMDRQYLRKIIQEEIRAVLRESEASNLYPSIKEPYDLYSEYGYYDHFRFGRRYSGYFS